MPMRCLLSMSAAIAILALAGCTGDPGPQGPTGPAGQAGPPVLLILPALRAHKVRKDPSIAPIENTNDRKKHCSEKCRSPKILLKSSCVPSGSAFAF
jgi:hypothetical protein